MMYEIVNMPYGTVIRRADGAEIPQDDGNVDYLAYLAWVGDGNRPASYTPPVPTEADYSAAIQAHVDGTARLCGYADGVACCSYHDSSNPTWAAESAAFKAWRDSVWSYAFTQLAAVQSNQREQPTVAELIAELPAITWPT